MNRYPRRSCRKATVRQSQLAFTLVELLVVLTIVGLMASLAIPGLASMGAFARDDLRTGTRDLYGMIRSARNHAVTYRKNTAVVYVLDNYEGPGENENPDNLPVLSDEQAQRREIRAAGVFVEAPPMPGGSERVFVPVESEFGEFRSFPGETAILLQDPDNPDISYYESARPRFNEIDAMPADNNDPSIFDLGMEIINVEVAWVDDNGDEFVTYIPFPAHVFRTSGRLEASGNKERYTIHYAPGHAAPPEERLLEPEAVMSPRIANPIHLYRSTGRVQIAT